MRAGIKATANVLAHTPHLVIYGSKPSRDVRRDSSVLLQLTSRLRSLEDVLLYPPNRVFVGDETPESLWEIERPWWTRRDDDGVAVGHPNVLPERAFYALMALADDCNIVTFHEPFLRAAQEELSEHEALQYLFRESRVVGQKLADPGDAPASGGELLLRDAGQVVGRVRPGPADDVDLRAEVLLENLACKATAVFAVRSLLSRMGSDGRDIDYVISSGEEAIGDRYQRGGGNLAKAVAEKSGCVTSSGSDVKAFCCGPLHAIVMAGALVEAGVFGNVLVVGGGSLAKLGMKSAAHVRHGMPILEDVLAGFAVLIGRASGSDPVLRLEAVGRHEVQDGGSAEKITEALVLRPLERLGWRLEDIDRYAVELHNPEITEPAGSGNVPRSNYRSIAALGVLRGLLKREELDGFERARGMPGFSPTQGHIASAVPYLVHATRLMRQGELRRAMFIAKGSLFLGRMTNASDGLSLILECPGS